MTQPINQLMNQLITEVFVKQPLALPGSAKYLPSLQDAGGLFEFMKIAITAIMQSIIYAPLIFVVFDKILFFLLKILFIYTFFLFFRFSQTFKYLFTVIEDEKNILGFFL